MFQHFSANGKLLLSGEYAILDGAKGLALPTKLGQTMNVTGSADNRIRWKAMDPKKDVWLECVFSDTLEILSASNLQQAEMLLKLFKAAITLSEKDKLSGISVETHLEFPNNWGLGSSSTLVSLLAQYVHCDPYILLERSFGGSGYDIACATSGQPITFQKSATGRIIQQVNFAPPFRDQLYFLHLGKKQDSRAGIQQYHQAVKEPAELVTQVSDITEKLINARELDEFCYYLELHEMLISNALHIKKVKDRLFPDFPGTVKSLGAWGGDFVCVASEEDEDMIRRYFEDKGFFTLLKYSEIILS